jgi:hypothetical protein
MGHPTRVLGLFVIAGIVSFSHLASGEDSHRCARPASVNGSTPVRVRTTNTRLGKLIRDGLERSPTFGRLVAGLEGSDLIVYIEVGTCRGGYPSCLVLVGRYGGQRYVRITVPANEGDRVLLIAGIGHELQHANEVAAAPDVVDAKSLLAFYARLDLRDGRGDESVETAAAVRAGRVMEEMYAAHRSARR